MAKEKEQYIIVYDWITEHLQLSGNERMIYALLYGYCKSGEWCTVSQEKIAKRIGATVVGVTKAIDSLLSKGYIKRLEIKGRNGKAYQYNISVDKSTPKQSLPLNKVYPQTKLGSTPKQSLGVTPKQSLPNNKDNNNIIINSTTTTNAHEQDKLLSEIDELKNDRIWIEPICMKHKINLSDLDVLFDAFILECQCNAVTGHIDIADAKRHFNSWLRIYKSKENGTNSNSKQRGNGYVRQPTPSENIEAARAEQYRRMGELDGKAEKPTFDVFPKL